MIFDGGQRQDEKDEQAIGAGSNGLFALFILALASIFLDALDFYKFKIDGFCAKE